MTDVGGAFEAAARAVRTAGDFEGLVRPLLAELQRATGLESTYLTSIHWEDAKQEILFSRNAGELEITEGLLVEWCDTLCRRALLGGPTVTSRVPDLWPDSDAARTMGITSYASVPIVLRDSSIVGTLCGASTEALDIDEAILDLFSVFALLIGEAIDREHVIADERAVAVAAETRFRERLALIAAAEHRLKTPLTVLAGWSDMLANGWDELAPELRREGVDAIARNVRSMRELVDELLGLARGDYLNAGLHLRVMDIAPVLLTAAHGYERAGTEHNWHIDVDGPLLAPADAASIEQVIGHLLDNAMKFTPAGGHITLAAHRNGDEIEIRVSDTGVGLPPDTSELFRPFVRGSSVPHTAGAGIGLYVVQSLLDAHGATVVPAPNEPTGATFTIHLAAAP